MGHHHISVANTLHELGGCVRKAGRLDDAEALYRRTLKIVEAGPNKFFVANTLHNLGLCVRKAGRQT